MNMKRNLLHWLLLLVMTACFISCGNDETQTPDAGATVEVTTKTVSEVTGTTAVCGGKVISEGTPAVTARGVCWSTGTTPTVADSKTSDGTGVGEFRSMLSGLVSGSVYYVRAYAIVSAGTVYGKAISFTAGASVPVVTTSEVTEISYKTAVGGGEIVNPGAGEVTDCGVCWSVNEAPTTDDSNVMDDPTEGEFSLPIDNLESGTTYYVRAFAVSSEGTGYGEQVSFTTREESLITLADANFMAYCLESFDLNFDGKLQASEAADVKVIDCTDRGVASLEGIAHFPALESLTANDNPIETVDLSGNSSLTTVGLIRTNIKTLAISDMPQLATLLCDGLKEENVGVLTSLTVKNCPLLKEVFCQENSLTTLLITNCPELTKLCVFRNLLTSLDLAGSPKLAVLEAWDNPFESLNISGNKELAELKITRNRLTSLELTDMPVLQVLQCDGLKDDQVGPMKSLTVRNCAALTEIFCQENSLESFAVSGCPALEKICAFRNRFNALDLSNNTGLKTLQVAASQLTSLKLAGCSSLDLLDAPDNQIASLDLSGCASLREMWLQGNKALTSIDLSQTMALQIFRGMNTGIHTLDLSNHTALTSVWCDGCGMESLNVTGCSKLTELKCQNNNLSMLNVQGCSGLGVLWADNNSLASLNLSGCNQLTECMVQINRAMTSLNVTGCSKLAVLQAFDCALELLDLSTCDALELVQLNDNKLTSLAVHGSKLHDVHCVRNQINSFTITSAPALTTIWIHDNLLKTLDVSQCAMQMNTLGVCMPAEPEAHGNPLETLYVKNGQAFAEKFIPATTNTVIK